MGKILFVALVAGVWWALAHDRVRDQLTEIARDVSDTLMMFLLRVTSGFASDVGRDVLREERERRLRWR